MNVVLDCGLLGREERDRYPGEAERRGADTKLVVFIVLIGMPGLVKPLARYASSHARVGLVHHFRTLSDEEMPFILAHHWQRLGLTLSPTDFTDAEAVVAVTRAPEATSAWYTALVHPDRADSADQRGADYHQVVASPARGARCHATGASCRYGLRVTPGDAALVLGCPEWPRRT